jgi:hypothetical protein
MWADAGTDFDEKNPEHADCRTPCFQWYFGAWQHGTEDDWNGKEADSRAGRFWRPDRRGDHMTEENSRKKSTWRSIGIE